ncbi:MAG: alpha/beta hydrolase [Pseudomonadota bacterium]|jgi:pimeloyl-ACP methyl ester carboxylesterase|nr:alpha/beta hydrolase [Pseudomonadota bacterium]
MLTIALGILIVAGLGAYANSVLYASRINQAHPPSGQLVEVEGSEVHVLRQGESGPVVLMIHGASANAREFSWSLAPRLAETHQVLMVDRPGHGHSERPDKADTLAVQASQVAGALKTLAPGRKAILVGHSFGGAVSLRLALDHPELVDGLVLLAPVTHDWGGGGEAWYNKYASHPLIGPAFTQLVPIVGPSQVRAGINNVFSPKPAPAGYFENSAIGLLFRPSNFTANARDVNGLRAELAAQQDRYDEITVPTVVFSGALDTVISPQLHVGRLKHQIDGLQLVKLADGGHMPHHAFGGDVADAIRRMSVSPAEAAD